MADTPDHDHGQPAPRPAADGAVSAHDLVCGDITRAFAENGPTEDASATLATLADRRDYGLGKYGTVLHADDGRDHLVDAIEELADAVCYLRLEMSATPGGNGQVVAALYAETVRVLVGLHAVRGGRA